MITIGEFLKQCRIKRDLTQFQVSEAVNCTVTYVSYVECGRRLPSFKMLQKLAMFYRTDIVVVIGQNGEIFYKG